MKIAILLICSVASYAADLLKPEPPTIPAEIQSEIFATQLDAKMVSEANDKAQAAAQSAIAKGQAACGDKYTLNRVGMKLECVAKPEAKK